MKKILIALLIIVSSVSAGLYFKVQSLNEKYLKEVENVKAYEAQLSSSENENRVFKLSIDQLKSSKDSIVQRMDEVRKELGIKDKRIEQLQYQLGSISRTDTIHSIDTIFKDPSFMMDTIIGDKWFNNHITLKYPNIIITEPSVLTENFVFISSNRETVKPPKKFFISRWFQKRHTVTEVIVEEKNPYVKIKTQRFIKTTK